MCDQYKSRRSVLFEKIARDMTQAAAAEQLIVEEIKIDSFISFLMPSMTWGCMYVLF